MSVSVAVRRVGLAKRLAGLATHAYLAVIGLSLVVPLQSQADSRLPATTVATPSSSAEIDAVLADARARHLDRLPFAALVQAVAKLPALMGKPYVAGSLDHAPDHETLLVSLAGYDCVTYPETVLALARTLSRSGDAQMFVTELAALRYRHGEPAYCERLHYFSDWVRRNAERGVVEDVTAMVAGSSGPAGFHALPEGMNFMSRHADALPALSGSAPRHACIAAAETDLSAGLIRNAGGVPGIAYLDRAQLLVADARLEGGDLLALVADAPGLDVIHVGIVVDGSTAGVHRVAHASSRRSHVEVAADLRAWLDASPRARGAIVVRPLPPDQN